MRADIADRGTPVVHVKGLTRRKGDATILDKVDLEAFPGEHILLFGSSGAGKTTLLEHIVGGLRAQVGIVKLFGQDPVLAPDRALDRVGYVSEKKHAAIDAGE